MMRRDSLLLLGLVAVLTSMTACGGGDESSSVEGNGGTGATGGTGGTGVGATGGGGDGTGGSGSTVCADLCAAKVARNCPTPASDCAGACEWQRGMAPWCQSTVDAYFQCLASAPTNFDCSGPNSTAVPAAGNACAALGTAMAGCWKEGPVGDFTQTCAAWCSLLNQLPACPPPADCQARCMGFVADAVQCSGAKATVIYCESKLTVADMHCTAANPPNGTANDPICQVQDEILLACLP
jgi:hypothetical protein